MSSALHLDIRPDAVVVLTIDQPDAKVNVLTPALVAELEAAVDSLAARLDLKGLVVASGKPGVFIAGADIKVFANALGPNDPAVRAYIENGLRVLEKLEALPFPTCAAIDGAALGGGLELALACDYRVCGTNPKVQLGLPEVKLGLIPGWGGTQRLPRIVGLTVAANIIAVGDGLAGRDGEAIDLVTTTVDSDQLLEFVSSMTANTTAESWQTERRSKVGPSHPQQPIPQTPVDQSTAAREAVRVMTEGAALPLYDAIKLETEAFLRLAGSDESKRLIAAFFASRKKGTV